MTVGYRVAYALHLTPWEQAGQAGADQLRALTGRARRGPGGGTALDVGCGTGAHAVALAQQGWTVTGVDAVPRALAAARSRAAGAGVTVRLVEADARTLEGVDAGEGFDLVLDVGCFHGLSDAGRTAMGAAVTRVAAPRAALVLMAMAPGRRGPGPRGASAADVTRAFPGWRPVHSEPAETAGLPRVLRGSSPTFHVLERA